MSHPSFELPDDSLKLFLSVDISGSTRFKNKYNIQKVHNVFKGKEILLSSIIDKLSGESSKPQHHLNREDLKKILPQFSYEGLSAEESDWAGPVQEIFWNFTSVFKRRLNKMPKENDATITFDKVILWKALGDEIIYVVNLKTPSQLHILVAAFSQALRIIDDTHFQKRKGLRLKGVAWIAGFPVRNRIIELPFLRLYRQRSHLKPLEPIDDSHIRIGEKRGKRLDSGSQYYIIKTDDIEQYPFPREDYLGPDMDIGFRIGKESWPGFSTMSMSLVCFLGREDNQHDKMKICHVGWTKLKGVRDEISYPIFWGKPTYDVVDQDYEEFSNIQQETLDNSYLQATKKQQAFQNARYFKDKIEEIRTSLPPELGVFSSFIPDSMAANPRKKELRNFFEQIINTGSAGQQTFNVEKDSEGEDLSSSVLKGVTTTVLPIDDDKL